MKTAPTNIDIAIIQANMQMAAFALDVCHDIVRQSFSDQEYADFVQALHYTRAFRDRARDLSRGFL